MGIALDVEIEAEYKPFEDAISKNDSDTLKALVSVYQENKLTLPVDVKAYLVTLASKEIVHQQAIKPRIFFPDRISVGALLLCTGQCYGFLVTMYKTLWPNDQNLPHGWAALKDPNNAILLTVMSGMMVKGIILTKLVYDWRFRKSEEKENEAALKKATKVLNLLQLFPTIA